MFSLVNDPVGQGLVASLSRPGGNITGFAFIDFPLPFYPAFLQELEAANKLLAVELSASRARRGGGRGAAITALAREPGGGLIAAPDVFLNNHRRAIMTLTERRRLPAIHAFRQFATKAIGLEVPPHLQQLADEVIE